MSSPVRPTDVMRAERACELPSVVSQPVFVFARPPELKHHGGSA